MRRLFKQVWLCYVAIVALCAFLGWTFYQSNQPSYKLLCFSKKNTTCHSIVEHLNKENWQEATQLLVAGLDSKECEPKELLILQENFSDTPFARAIQATHAVLKLRKTGLSHSILLPISLFIEISLKGKEQSLKYIPESRFGREIQVDPETGSVFIHLGTNNVKPIGKGKLKVVTKTIYYDIKHPRVYARALTDTPIANEIDSMKALKGKTGVISLVSALQHRDPVTNKTMSAVVTPIYNKRSLYKVLRKKKFRLTFEEKWHIATQILGGLTSMHENGYSHRDLGARNYFVSIHKKSNRSRAIECVIADFGRALPIQGLQGLSVQGNSYYYSPEGVIPSRMQGEMYKASDLFAVGCVFWQLYFDDLPPWSARIKHVAQNDMEREVESKKLSEKITKGHELIYALLNKNELAKKEAYFLKIILRLTSPDPTQRGSASELLAMMKQRSE